MISIKLKRGYYKHDKPSLFFLIRLRPDVA